jgi:hypothetical protein
MTNISYVRERRNMPFLKRGMKVEVNGKLGIIKGGDPYGLLRVDFDGEMKSCNPKVDIRYFDKDGNIIAEYY